MLEITAQLQHTLMGHGCFGSKREMMKHELCKNTFGDRIYTALVSFPSHMNRDSALVKFFL